jgi:hypothetical protein
MLRVTTGPEVVREVGTEVEMYLPLNACKEVTE